MSRFVQQELRAEDMTKSQLLEEVFRLRSELNRCKAYVRMGRLFDDLLEAADVARKESEPY